MSCFLSRWVLSRALGPESSTNRHPEAKLTVETLLCGRVPSLLFEMGTRTSAHEQRDAPIEHDLVLDVRTRTSAHEQRDAPIEHYLLLDARTHTRACTSRWTYAELDAQLTCRVARTTPTGSP